MSINIINVITLEEYRALGLSIDYSNDKVQEAINLTYFQLNNLCNHNISRRWNIEEGEEGYILPENRQLVKEAFVLQTQYNLVNNLNLSEGSQQTGLGSWNHSYNNPTGKKQICAGVEDLLQQAGLFQPIVSANLNVGKRNICYGSSSFWVEPLAGDCADLAFVRWGEANAKFLNKYQGVDLSGRLLYVNNNGYVGTMSVSELPIDLTIYLTKQEAQNTYATITSLDDEIANRRSADTLITNALTNRIDVETGIRQSEDTALGTRIDNEAIARENADDALNNLCIALGTNKQDKNDNGLQTTSKNVVGGINEVNFKADTNTLDIGALETSVGNLGSNIATINGKIPSQATSTNQLADKNFVNSSIATNTANFIGTFNSLAELQAYTGTLTNNDYAFVRTTDTAGNTLYDRYKYVSSTQTWLFEYELNNSSFTASQWEAINSGATTTNIAQISTNASNITAETSNRINADDDLQNQITTNAGNITNLQTNKQDKTDNTLTTTDKTIVGAINELKNSIPSAVTWDTTPTANHGAGYAVTSAGVKTYVDNVSTNLSTETTNRTNADTALSNRVTTLENKHLYWHRIYLKWDNGDNNKKVIWLYLYSTTKSTKYTLSELYSATINPNSNSSSFLKPMFVGSIDRPAGNTWFGHQFFDIYSPGKSYNFQTQYYWGNTAVTETDAMNASTCTMYSYVEKIY